MPKPKAKIHKAKPIEVSGSEFEAFVVRGGKSALVDFWAEWCRPCKLRAPILEEIADEFAGKITILKVNVDESPDAAENFGIRAIPTMLLFSKGTVADQIVGASSKRDIKTRVERLTYKADDAPDEQSLLALTFDKGKLKLVSLLEDGSYHFLDEASRFHKLVYTFSTSDLALIRATEEFENMVNDPNLKEKYFQEFINAYPDFILNDEYAGAHSHVVLERNSSHSGPLIPDFFLEPFNKKTLCDILDIKTPGAKILRLQKNRIRFSDAVMEGVAQLREYQAYFEDSRLRELVQEKYGLTAYRPKLFLVIGRRGKVDPFVLRRLETDLPNVTIRTFDDVLDRMKNRIKRGRIL